MRSSNKYPYPLTKGGREVRNQYSIRGDVALIHLKHRRKDVPNETAVIDLEELPKALAFKGRFHPFIHQRTKKTYTRGFYKDPGTGRVSQPLLHRVIMNPTRGENTAHISDDTLLCTKANMQNVRLGTSRQALLADIQVKQERLQIRAEKQADAARQQAAAGESFLAPQTTTAGVWLPDLASLSEGGLKVALAELKEAGAVEKGVSFHKQKRRWEVSAFADGIRHRLGYWPPVDLKRANKEVKLFRAIGPVDYFAGVGKGSTF